MDIVYTAAEVRDRLRSFGDACIGFVPTMGALHAGHAALVTRSVAECDVTVVSVYVNPTQFDNQADLQKYPEKLATDAAMCAALGTKILFAPGYAEIYPDQFRYQIDEKVHSRELCGAHRPGHFTGVLTVVMKLLNIVRPARAYFGEKDYQQLQLIKGMAEAFFLPTEVIGCATVREADGLALSSRNQNLSPEARRQAPLMHRLIASDRSDEQVRMELSAAGFDVDYVVTQAGRRFVAARLGTGAAQVRLIDNVRRQE
jgi:pantoate--beta-alanine ligase